LDELMAEFLTETAENLAALDIELVKLEQDPNAPGLLANIFRLVHTIKGTCGFFGLPRLEMLAHAAENVLGRFRDGELVVTPQAITVILAAIDGIKAILVGLEATEAEPDGDDGALIARLNALAEAWPPAAAQDEPGLAEPEPSAVFEPAAAGREPDAVAETPAPTDPEADAVGPGPLAGVQDAAAFSDDAVLGDLPRDREEESDRDEPSTYRTEPRGDAGHRTQPAANGPADAGSAAEQHQSAVGLQSIRVDVDLLESLMTTVSELVLSRNQLLQIARRQQDSEFAAPLQRLNQVVSQLQEGVMKTRMQPIGNAWAKLPRIVRDLTHELGKKVDLVMKGAETELDRQVLELIRDPLTHLVRNSVDHGIEPPAERRRAGKPETGVIVLEAFHQGGQIVIEISDDGRGLNVDKIKGKALAQGLVSEAELPGLADNQIHQFIFRAGFSTAETVTSVSGRGVGMDVVRSNVEKIGGAIDLSSRSGFGSKFTIKIPLTLAIVSALLVEAAGQRFAVPQTGVVELVCASDGSTGGHRIERINGTPVLRLRDRLLPLIILEDLLKLRRPGETLASDERFVVVTRDGSRTFGMIVDQVFDTEEIVVKPVAPVVRHIPMFSGNTILGDGSVIMILDPGGIAGTMGDIAAAAEVARTETIDRASDARQKSTLLLFRAGSGSPKAVPLESIARLEEFDRRQIEIVTGHHVIQYRGALTPLVTFDPLAELSAEGRQPALVFTYQSHVVALLVDDIVETDLNIHHGRNQPGIIGSAIIAGRATELIDAEYFCKQAFEVEADWFGDAAESQSLLPANQAAVPEPTAMARAA
jgi:two-component system, chemotaxis family, sensor kinase CheA